MNNFDRVREMVDEYVKLNGSNTEMDRNEFIDWVHERYENISVEKNNLYPTDISYNLYNAGLKDFPGPNLCLVYVEESERFRLVGTGYKHTGPIWQYKGKTNETVVGMWNDGVCKMGTAAAEDLQLPENILYRRDELFGGVKGVLKAIPVTVATEKSAVTVKFQELLICGINVEAEAYKIYNVSSEWADQTSYLCEESEDETWHYYLETIDECIGETQRLVMFEAQKGKKKPEPVLNGKHTSELSVVLNGNAFKQSFEAFIKQADANALSGKGAGGQTPFGFSGKPRCDGADVSTHYGQGGASKTPYLNWWVVSIYYIPDTGNITMGIEENRYPHLKEMAIKPMRYTQIGNKKEQIAVFYSATKASINYAELYESFINVCEEVMRIGLK